MSMALKRANVWKGWVLLGPSLLFVLALTVARSPAFAEGDDGAGEGNGADGRTNRHFDEAGRANFTDRSDTVGIGRKEGCCRDENCRQPDQTVESRDQLRQGSHLDLQRNNGAD